MKIIINDIEKDVPFTMDAITLGQYRDFQLKYENEITANPDLEALAWFTFWTGFDFLEVKDEEFVKPAIEQYQILSTEILKNENELVPYVTDRIVWNDEFWSFQDFIVDRSRMSYNDHITSREVLKLSYLFKANPWKALHQLCAIFFRKVNEPYSPDLFEERSQLMDTLPMHIAMAIKNYLTEVFKKDIEDIKPKDIETDFSTD